MPDNQIENYEEELKSVISKLEVLYIKRNDKLQEIDEYKQILLNIYNYSFANTQFKFIWMAVLFINLIVYSSLSIPYLFAVISSSLLFGLAITTTVIFGLLGLALSSVPFKTIKKLKNISNYKEEDVKKLLKEAKELFFNLDKEITKLESLKRKYNEKILNKTIELMLSLEKEIDDFFNTKVINNQKMKNLLLNEFDEFLNEKIDYSKICLENKNKEKEYKLKLKNQ